MKDNGVTMKFWMATNGLREIHDHHENDAPGVSAVDFKLRKLFPESGIVIKTDTASRRSFAGRRFDHVEIKFPQTEAGKLRMAWSYLKLMTMSHVMPFVPGPLKAKNDTQKFEWTGCPASSFRSPRY